MLSNNFCKLISLSRTAALLDVLLLMLFTTTLLSHSSRMKDPFRSSFNKDIALMTASNSR
jgi:hypothetical protein